MLYMFVMSVFVVGVRGNVATQVCVPEREVMCPSGQTCMYTDTVNKYGQCVRDENVCSRESNTNQCGAGRRCLTTGISDNKEISVCIEENMFCVGGGNYGLNNRCLVTDRRRNEGIRVLNRQCSLIMDIGDGADCPANHRCCFNRGMDGVCMKGDYKDIVVEC